MELSHISEILFSENIELFVKNIEKREGDESEEEKHKGEIVARRFDPNDYSSSDELNTIFTKLNMGNTSRADYIFLAYNEKGKDQKQIVFFLIEIKDVLWKFKDKYTEELKNRNSKNKEKSPINLRDELRDRLRENLIKKFVGSVEILCRLDGVCTQFKDEKTDAKKLNVKELSKFMEDCEKSCKNKISKLCGGKHIVPQQNSTQRKPEDDQCWFCRNWHPEKINGDEKRNKFFYTVLIPTSKQEIKRMGLDSTEIRVYTNMRDNINESVKDRIKPRGNSSFVSMIGGDLLCSYEIFEKEVAKYTDSKESL